MAGTLVLVPTDRLQELEAAPGEKWEIQFARFFGFPTLSSTCPNLVPLLPKFLDRRPRGTWLSSSSSAFLHLANGLSGSEAILTVSLRGRILEQHYVSKLHFSWPHVSCLSGFPARGIRAVFVSFKDHVGKVDSLLYSSQCYFQGRIRLATPRTLIGMIQKFALQFSKIDETEMFINALKDILKDVRDTTPLNSDLGSEILSQSEFMSSNQHSNRACEDFCYMNPSEAYAPQISPSFNNKVEEHLSDKESETTLSHNIEGGVAALPPSFTSLLANCYSEVNQGASQSTGREEFDLKSRIVRCMEDSSFHGMLTRVEKVISEMEGELTPWTSRAECRTS